MSDRRIRSCLSILLISCVFIALSFQSIKAETPGENFMNWLITHQTTGGTYTLTNDIVISRDLILSDGADHPSITVNTGDYTITVQENRHLSFLNSNIHIQGNTTLFQVEPNASLEFSNLNQKQEDFTNQLITKHGPAISIEDNGMLFVDTDTDITAQQGSAMQCFKDGFMNLHDAVIHGFPAVDSQGDVLISTSEVFGAVRASSIEAQLTIFHDNPEIKQDVYHLGYQSVTDEIYREGTRYVNTIPGADLRSIVPKSANIQTYTEDFQLSGLWLPIRLTYDTLPSITSDDVGKTESIQSGFQFSDFQQKLIDAGLLDITTADAPIIEVKVLPKNIRFGICFSTRFMLCADVFFAIPPGITDDTDVYFEISTDGQTWMPIDMLSSFDIDYMDHEAYVSLDNTFQDENGNTLKLEYNHTYHIRMGIKNGPMQGVSTPLVIKITTDILDQNFFNPLADDETSGSIEHPDQPPPLDNGSIDGNRGGGGQKEGIRDKRISSSSHASNSPHAQTADANQAPVNGTNNESSDQPADTSKPAKTFEKRQHQSSDSLTLIITALVISALFMPIGICFYVYKSNKSA